MCGWGVFDITITVCLNFDCTRFVLVFGIILIRPYHLTPQRKIGCFSFVISLRLKCSADFSPRPLREQATNDSASHLDSCPTARVLRVLENCLQLRARKLGKRKNGRKANFPFRPLRQAGFVFVWNSWLLGVSDGNSRPITSADNDNKFMRYNYF